MKIHSDHEHCAEIGACWQEREPCPALTPEQRLANEQTPRLDEDGREIIQIATCGVCGRSWNDAAISAWTPTPSGRCPFEYEHDEQVPA